jgi:hypothetical protein
MEARAEPSKKSFAAPDNTELSCQSLFESSTAQDVHTVVRLQDTPKRFSVVKTIFSVLKILSLPENNLALQRRAYTSPL